MEEGKMEERILKGKKNGMLMLILTVLVYAIAAAGVVIGAKQQCVAFLIIGIVRR